MKCNHCHAELDEGVTLCPECGTENAPAAETPVETAPEMKQGLSAGKITLLVVLAVVAIGVVIALIMGGIGSEVDPTSASSLPTESMGTAESVDPTGETETEPVATVPADGNPDDVTCKGTYTVTDEEAAAAADVVVATMGDAELTNGELQIYYWMQIYDFLNNYGSYASMFGLDYTQSLDTQVSMDGTGTWQQYFLDSAILSWQNYKAMELLADENGYQMEQEYADYLESLPAELEATAQSAGYASAQEMIQSDMGPGSSLAAYEKYMRTYYVGYLYYSSELEKITLTDEEVEAFFDENAESYLANGLEKTADRYVDVRHILLQPTGGTTAEDGTTTYSEEEWAQCKLEAETVLNEWLAGEQTEERFAELAETYSTDGGSNTNGGLYTDVYMGQMVEPFENWCFDTTRKPGDYGIVQTDYGYHVMYFVDSNPIWYVTAWNDLMTQRSNEFVESAMNAYETTVDYSAMVLGFVDLASAS